MVHNTLMMSRVDDILTVTMNRPDKLNAILVPDTFFELVDVIESAAADSSLKAMILTGAGRAFCAGADLSQRIENRSATANKNLIQRVVTGIRHLPMPVIAAVNGVAAGAGASLAMATDFIIASERASFIQAFANVGLHPDLGAAWTLPRLVGLAMAKELMFTGREIKAEEAHRIGLVNRVVAHDTVLEEALLLSRHIAAKSALSVRLAKDTLNRSELLGLAETIDLELQRQQECFASPEFRTQVDAFRNRRKPSTNPANV